MRAILSAGLSGLVFGLGLALSGMINPAKVLNFLDLAGQWDPSLALVMASALAVTFAGYRLVLGRETPYFEGRFQLPTARDIDAKLLGGAAIFGVGWGLAGFCPGPVLTAAGLALPQVFIFLAAMLGTIGLYRWIQAGITSRHRSGAGKQA